MAYLALILWTTFFGLFAVSNALKYRRERMRKHLILCVLEIAYVVVFAFVWYEEQSWGR